MTKFNLQYFFRKGNTFLRSSFPRPSLPVPRISYLVLFLFLILCIPLFSQNKKIDSLLTLLKTDKEDTNKAKHLNFLSNANIAIGNYDTAAYYCGVSISLSQKLNFKRGIAASYAVMGIVFSRKGDYEKALSSSIKSLSINEELNDLKGVAKNLSSIGTIYSRQDEYSKSLGYYKKALNIYEKLQNKKGIASQLCNIGINFCAEGNYPMSLEYYFKGLKLFEEMNDTSGITNILGNIGNVYGLLNDNSKALEGVFRALKLDSLIGNKNGMARHLGTIGILYRNMKDYQKALIYNFRALKISEELGEKNTMSTHFGNIAIVYDYMAEQSEKQTALQNNLRQKALTFHLKCLKMKRELGEKNNIATIESNIGSFYIGLKKYKTAYDYLKSALILADSIRALHIKKGTYELMSILYETSNIALPDTAGSKLLNMEQMRLRALYYHKKYISLRDTLFSEENKKQIVRKEMNFEFEKKEAETKAEQEKKNSIQEAESKKQKIIMFSVVGCLLLVICFAGFIFQSLRKTKKQKLIIEHQKELVDEKQKEILDSIRYAKRIQTALITSEKYFGRKLNELNK